MKQFWFSLPILWDLCRVIFSCKKRKKKKKRMWLHRIRVESARRGESARDRDPESLASAFRGRVFLGEIRSLLGVLRMLYDKLYLCGAVLRWFETRVTTKEAAYPSGTPQRTPAAARSLGGHRSRPRSGHPDIHTRETNKPAFFLFSFCLSFFFSFANFPGAKARMKCKNIAHAIIFAYTFARSDQ